MRSLRRFHVAAEVVVPRSVGQVWAELESPERTGWGHPSWESTPLAGPTGPVVGAGSVAVVPASGPEGLRSVWLTRVTSVMPRFSVTSETITPHLELVETTRFYDVDGLTSRLTIEGWYSAVMTAEAVARLQPGFQRLAQEHLDRVANWRPDVS